jgi:3-hydroxymyristoyl/3-hydroxydecanoyl-(acyl carrier protein) dehydratase
MLEHRAQMKIPADHPCLAGHFPGNPVVPAVVLLDCVARALNTALGRAVMVSAIPSAKFLGPLAPGEEFGIELVIETGSATARFRCVVNGQERVQGRLEYRDGA